MVAKATLYDAAGDTERAGARLDKASRSMPEVILAMAGTDFALRLGRVDEAERFAQMAEAADPGERSGGQRVACFV